MTASSGDNSNISGKHRMSRQERLAAELRANLKRRKLKSRTVGPAESGDPRLDPAPEHADSKDC